MSSSVFLAGCTFIGLAIFISGFQIVDALAKIKTKLDELIGSIDAVESNLDWIRRK